MLPNFLIEETTVREAGESCVFEASETSNQPLQFTLEITHAVEHESIRVDILASKDGRHWMSVPLASFTPKCYCGTYKLMVMPGEARYLKAVWRPQRWSREDKRPFFRFFLYAEPARDAALAASAA